MTKDDAVDKFEHSFAGAVLDAWSTPRSGAEAHEFVKKICANARAMLGQVFEEGFRHAQEDAARFQSSGPKSNGMFGEEAPSKTKKGRNNDVE